MTGAARLISVLMPTFEQAHFIGRALDRATSPCIAYLPSDDIWYRDHLQSLLETLRGDASAILAFAGILHHYSRTARGVIDGYPLQLVQTMHRRSATR